MEESYMPGISFLLFELATGSIIVFLILLIRGFTFRSKTLYHDSSPLERVIRQAKLTNQRNGHENEGYLSLEAGFCPSKPPAQALPRSHEAWDQLASSLPELIQTQTLRETIDRMPLLSADSKEALPDWCLHRAASILGMMAHAYVRMEGETSLTVKYSDHSEVLPRALYVPWTQVCKRLGRPNACLSYVDLVISNFRTTSNTYSHMTLENSELLVGTINNKEERTFYGTMIEINSRVIPIMQHAIDAQRAVINDDPDLLEHSLTRIIPVIQEVTRTFHKISPSRMSRSYVDPVIWTKTVANLAVPWLQTVGAAGTAHPFFHMMDEFTERLEYKSRIGKEAMHIRATFPLHWRQCLEAVTQVSVKKYILDLESKRGKELLRIWSALEDSYSGRNGLLGVHRRKVYGYLSVSFRVGRDSTINGLGRTSRAKQWNEADDELENSRLERNRSVSTIRVKDGVGVRESTFTSSQIIRHTSETEGYWFAVGKHVYDASNFMHAHPGGSTIIALCSGQDVTPDLEATMHLSDPKIKLLLEKYRKGSLRALQFIEKGIGSLYEAVVRFGEAVAETENLSRITLSSLFSRMTMVDEANQPSPLKLKHLIEYRNQLKAKHAPKLLTLIYPALQELEKLDRRKEIRDVSHELATNTSKLVASVQSPSIRDMSNWNPALDLLKKDISRLAEMKELTIRILEKTEAFAGETHSLDYGTIDLVGEHLIYLQSSILCFDKIDWM